VRVCPVCGVAVFGRKTYCNDEHKQAAWRQTQPRAQEKEGARRKYAATHQPTLWPCKQCGGLMLHPRRPTHVCSNCHGDSGFVPVKVVARADRPPMIYFGTMNILTRFADAETLHLVCGYSAAIPALEALVETLHGVSTVEERPSGIVMFEALIPAAGSQVAA
jgi:hypothetical protein